MPSSGVDVVDPGLGQLYPAAHIEQLTAPTVFKLVSCRHCVLGVTVVVEWCLCRPSSDRFLCDRILVQASREAHRVDDGYTLTQNNFRASVTKQ